MQRAFFIDGHFYYCPERAAALIGLPASTIFRWCVARSTSYSLPLAVIERQGHLLIDERHVRVIAKVQRDYPVTRGPPSRFRRHQMLTHAKLLLAAAKPA